MSFRSEWVLVPLACVFMAWVLHVIQPACTWNELMTRWGIHDKRSFTMLACLGCAVVAIIAIARVLRRDNDDE